MLLKLVRNYLKQNITLKFKKYRTQADLAKAITLYEKGNLHSAEATLKKILTLAPENVNALNLLAQIAEQHKNDTLAITYLKKILEIQPKNSAAYASLGLLYQTIGKLDKAALYLNKSLKLNPSSAEVANNYGIVLLSQGRINEAINQFNTAITLDPLLAQGYCNLGIAFQKKRKIKEALSYFSKAVELAPNFSEGHCNFGLALSEAENPEEALRHLKLAIQLRNNYVDAYCNLGSLLINAGKNEEAREYLQKAISLNPLHLDSYCNLAIVLQNQGKFEYAMDYFNQALAINSEYPQAHLGKAYLLLLQGIFEEGWKEHEFRFSTAESPKRHFPYPEWDGSPLDEKRLFIYAEQGLGDEIMFASCLQDTLSLAPNCVVECDLRLSRIFQLSYPEITVVTREQTRDISTLKAIEPIGAHIAAGSLPKLFRHKLQDFPKHSGYLKADSNKIAFWKTQLAKLGDGLKIGVAWSGGLFKTKSALRSIPIEMWLSILKVPNVQFISLQYSGIGDELKHLQKNHHLTIHHWEEAIKDYNETAALVSSLDLVITVCTALVHLSGALGKKTWVMVPAAPEWRYLKEGNQMPWYPEVKLFRQTILHQWKPVIDKVAVELSKLNGITA